MPWVPIASAKTGKRRAREANSTRCNCSAPHSSSRAFRNWAGAACNGGSSGGSNPKFNLTVEAPGGSGFVGGNVNGLPFAPIVLRDYTLGAGVAVTGQVTDGLGAPLDGVDISFARYG